MKKIFIIITFLFSTTLWANFNFGECSGSGTFEQQINHFNGDYENAITVGDIPAGIKGLKIFLISDEDVDIRLYGENNDKIVHWPYGLFNEATEKTNPYKNTPITYSGYNGINLKKGHEFIEINGVTPSSMTMKAFGYKAGYATVNYSWAGKEGCSKQKSGKGNFSKSIQKGLTSLVGTIPPNVDNVKINLTSINDLDIQLYGADGTAIVSWKPEGLLAGSTEQSIDYHGMHIIWSGYHGVNGEKGHEYIKITGKTTEELVMKVYSYETGMANIAYSWGYGEVDIAHKYGKATQGSNNSYTYYRPAYEAIDNNKTTFSHSRALSSENWWQVEIPPTLVKKVIIRGMPGSAHKLNGVKVYLTDTPYQEGLTKNSLIHTLVGNKIEHIINLSPTKSKTYLILKAPGDTFLDLSIVKVFGEMPATPIFIKKDHNYIISNKTSTGDIVTTIKAIDYQEDYFTYTIIGSVPFNINSNGEITLKGPLNKSNYNFIVKIDDGEHSTTTNVNIEVTSNNVINEILASGDVIHTKILEQQLIQATLDEIEVNRISSMKTKAKIFNLNEDGSIKGDGSSLTSIDWDPTASSMLLLPSLGINFTLLYSNAVISDRYPILKKTMAIFGEKTNARYMTFGSNPLRNNINIEMEKVLENSMAWLTKRNDLKTKPFNIVIAHLNDTSSSPDEQKTREWLDTHYPGKVQYNNQNSCDGIALKGCLNNATDLLIISQVSSPNDNIDTIVSTVNKALADGIPVLYIHQERKLKPLGKALFKDVFNIQRWGDNHWRKLKIASYNPIDDFQKLDIRLKSIQTMFTHFKNKDYTFDWRKCKKYGTKYGKQYENCSEVINLNSDFQNAATEVRNIMNNLDIQKIKIFSKNGYRLQKLLILTADKFRQSISYPMDKVESDTNKFMRAYYSDHAIYNYRKINPKQPDLGNFSRSDFSHIKPVTRQVHLNSRKTFHSTGAYALPGETVRITRNDNSDLSVKVFINTLRTGSTHHFKKNGYTRPKYLQSTHFEIKPNETIEITSPYGGPIQLEFSKNDLPIDITFENVGEHPYWSSVADNQIFAQKLDANEYDWAEISTTGFEVHSTLEKMIQSIADPKWGGTAEGLAAAVVKYTSNYPHVLAGFKGLGIDVVPEIHDWATQKGLSIKTIDVMKHMNADQASCGSGCSGNPYDAYWYFKPIGHGDIHELGHSLQKMRFEGFPNHAATNTFVYYTKSRYFDNTGVDPDCSEFPFKRFFETIQSAVGQQDVQAYLKTNLWDKAGLDEQYLLKIEAMMHAQKLGKVKNGWHVLARVHILEREMILAKKDWEARKNSVGFSTYSLKEIKNIRNNDWLVVAYSYAAEVDYRNYFDMVGIPYSEKARNQIASFGFEAAPKSLFVSTPDGYCKEDAYGRLFNRPTLPIDGTTPYAY